LEISASGLILCRMRALPTGTVTFVFTDR
jgi:hypothetical protein